MSRVKPARVLETLWPIAFASSWIWFYSCNPRVPGFNSELQTWLAWASREKTLKIKRKNGNSRIDL
jgi:hypothetical protein